MLILIPSHKLSFNFSLNQGHQETLEGLISSFFESEGRDIFSKASKIIVVEENFFNVIKDRYGPPLIGEHIDELYNVVEKHLLV